MITEREIVLQLEIMDNVTGLISLIYHFVFEKMNIINGMRKMT